MDVGQDKLLAGSAFSVTSQPERFLVSLQKSGKRVAAKPKATAKSQQQEIPPAAALHVGTSAGVRKLNIRKPRSKRGEPDASGSREPIPPPREQESDPLLVLALACEEESEGPQPPAADAGTILYPFALCCCRCAERPQNSSCHLRIQCQTLSRGLCALLRANTATCSIAGQAFASAAPSRPPTEDPEWHLMEGEEANDAGDDIATPPRRTVRVTRARRGGAAPRGQVRVAAIAEAVVLLAGAPGDAVPAAAAPAAAPPAGAGPVAAVAQSLAESRTRRAPKRREIFDPSYEGPSAGAPRASKRRQG